MSTWSSRAFQEHAIRLIRCSIIHIRLVRGLMSTFCSLTSARLLIAPMALGTPCPRS